MYPCGAPDYSVSSAIPLKLSCFIFSGKVTSGLYVKSFSFLLMPLSHPVRIVMMHFMLA